MTFLIDSDRTIDYLKGRSEAVLLFDELLKSECAISVVTLGEIYEGVFYGQNRLRSEEKLAALLEAIAVIDVTSDIAYRYGLIRGDLRQRGVLISQTDILIAATAIHLRSTLVTRNLKHFTRIPGLTIFPSAETD